MMTKATADRLFNRIFLVLLFLLVVGTPLIFTSLTRSVFEVNKLLLLRLITLFTLLIWFFKTRFYADNGVEDQDQTVVGWGWFKWKPIGLEWPLLAWVGVNIISTILSQNWRISLIGAYDRWEGLITVTNYAILIIMIGKLVTTRRQLHWLIFGLISATILSAFYGIFQSWGQDFMRWSVDPTMRVFACINNPVHYCAYVGMIVPLGLGTLLYAASRTANASDGSGLWQSDMVMKILKWGLFFGITLIYYNQYLSYSRATWMGFIGAMTLYYLFIGRLFSRKSENWMVADFFATAAGISLFYLGVIFNLHLKGLVFMAIILGGSITYIGYLAWINQLRPLDKDMIPVWVAVTGLGVLFIQFQNLPDLVGSMIQIIAGISVAVAAYKAPKSAKNFLARLIIIALFAKLQFVAVSLTNMGVYLGLLTGFYFTSVKDHPDWTEEHQFWMVAFTFILAAVLVIPSLPTYLAKLDQESQKTESLQVLENVNEKIGSYASVAIDGTARTSMWKSAIPWIKDYPLFGTGPDTIKFMYPKYRRPEYGRLEGGHNFTPDRLHNEYLNTMATRGIIGFVVYYGFVILGWFLLMLRYLSRNLHNPLNEILGALMAGVMIYLGQVMFNFGVVATLVLFYIFMGLGLALINHPAFQSQDQ